MILLSLPFEGSGKALTPAEKEQVWHDLGGAIRIFLIMYFVALLIAYIWDRFLSDNYLWTRPTGRHVFVPPKHVVEDVMATTNGTPRYDGDFAEVVEKEAEADEVEDGQSRYVGGDEHNANGVGVGVAHEEEQDEHKRLDTRPKKQQQLDNIDEETMKPSRRKMKRIVATAQTSWKVDPGRSCAEMLTAFFSNKSLHDLVRALQQWMNAPEAVLDIIVCTFFVLRSYREEVVDWMDKAEAAFNAFFVFHFIVRLIDLNGMLRFLTKFRNICDLCAIIGSIYGISNNQWITLSFLRAVQLRYSVQNMNLGTVFSASEFAQQVQLFCADTLVLLYSFSCAIFITEYLGAIPGLDSRDPDDWNFVNAVYYVFITISTVGYGDFSPKTALGKLSAMSFVVYGLVLFSDSTSKLFQVAASAREGMGRFHNRAGDPHVILCGKPNLNLIKEFLHELYHPERLLVSQLALRRQVIILTEKLPFLEELKYFIRVNPIYRGRVRILVGTPLNDDDLDRARAADAEGVFVMNSVEKNCDNADEDDVGSLLRGMSIRQYIVNENTARLSRKNRVWEFRPKYAREVPLYMLLQTQHSETKLESAAHMMGTTIDNYAFRDQIKMGLFALSCIAPGFSTMIFNLVKSRGSEFHTQLSAHDWQYEYLYGASMEIYVQRLKDSWTQRQFGKVAAQIFTSYNIILFGYIHPETGVVHLNPMGAIPKRAFGILIAESDEQATAVAQYVDDERQTSMHNQSDTDHMRSQFFSDIQKSPSHRDRRYTIGQVLREEVAQSENQSSDEMESKQEADVYDEDSLQQQPSLDGPTSLGLGSYVPNLRPAFRDRQKSYVLRMSSTGSVTDLPPPPDSACSKHVVVICLDSEGIQHFIKPIRERERRLRKKGAHRVRTQPIVIVCPQESTVGDFADWSTEHTNRVYYYQAKIHDRTMSRLKLERAEKIVVLSSHGNGTSLGAGAGDKLREEQLGDANVIFTVLRVRHYLQYKNASNVPFIVGEVEHSSSIKYLSQNLPRYSSLHDCPSFAAGEVIAGSIAHLVMIQTFFNPQFLAVINTLMTSSSSEYGSHIFQLPLKNHLAKFGHATFGELFRYLLMAENCIALGLLRHNEHSTCAKKVPGQPEIPCSGHTAPKPFVFTCPDKSVVLCPHDRVYVLSQTTPPALQSQARPTPLHASTPDQSEQGERKQRFSFVAEEKNADVDAATGEEHKQHKAPEEQATDNAEPKIEAGDDASNHITIELQPPSDDFVPQEVELDPKLPE